MISQTAEYALRAVVFLAERGNRPHTIRQIAAATQVPAGYLAKVMQALTRAGLVHGRRGLGGGFVLTRPPGEMSCYDILQAVDPIPRITRCPLDNPAHAHQLCPLHERLDEAAAQIEKSFRASTIAELTTRPVFTAPTPAPEGDESDARSPAAGCGPAAVA
jgi:Rrf2 family protein